MRLSALVALSIVVLSNPSSARSVSHWSQCSIGCTQSYGFKDVNLASQNLLHIPNILVFPERTEIFILKEPARDEHTLRSTLPSTTNLSQYSTGCTHSSDLKDVNFAFKQFLHMPNILLFPKRTGFLTLKEPETDEYTIRSTLPSSINRELYKRIKKQRKKRLQMEIQEMIDRNRILSHTSKMPFNEDHFVRLNLVQEMLVDMYDTLGNEDASITATEVPRQYPASTPHCTVSPVARNGTISPVPTDSTYRLLSTGRLSGGTERGVPMSGQTFSPYSKNEEVRNDKTKYQSSLWRDVSLLCCCYLLELTILCAKSRLNRAPMYVKDTEKDSNKRINKPTDKVSSANMEFCPKHPKKSIYNKMKKRRRKSQRRP